MRLRLWSIGIVVAALFGVGLLSLLRPTGELGRPDPPVARPVAGGAALGDTGGPAGLSDAFDEQRQTVTAACDLDLDAGCGDGYCAALTVMPDLDRLGGWLQVSASHPRLVVSTVLRDLGIPAGGIPCGAAVASLAAEHGVAAVELPDGTEVWCAVSGDEAAGFGWCGARATDRLGRAVAFGADARRLAFDRGAR